MAPHRPLGWRDRRPRGWPRVPPPEDGATGVGFAAGGLWGLDGCGAIARDRCGVVLYRGPIDFGLREGEVMTARSIATPPCDSKPRTDMTAPTRAHRLCHPTHVVT